MWTNHRLREERRRAIDDEILELRNRILVLATSRNELLPVSCLSDDILLLIFTEVCAQAHADAFDNPLRSNLKQALRVSWVSREWRRVALDDAKLWTKIDLPSCSKGASALLIRSKGAPLCAEITINFRDAIPPEVGVVLGQLRRIQSLMLRAVPSQTEDLEDPQNIVCLLDATAPALENLSLEGVHIPESTFGAHSPPSLRELSLRACHTSWSLPLFNANLTVLNLDYPPTRLPLSTLLLFFERMPNLVELRLEYALDTTVEHMKKDLQLSLPYLKIFHLKGVNVDTMTYILRHTSFAQIRQVHACLSLVPDDTADGSIIKAVYKMLGKASPILFLSLEKSSGVFYANTEVSQTNQPLYLRVPLRDPDFDVYSLSSNMLDLTQLRWLELSGKCLVITPDIWRMAFGSLPQLQRLELYDSMVKSFIKLLDEEGEAWNNAYTSVLPRVVPLDDESEARKKYLDACAEVKEFLDDRGNVLFPALRDLILVYHLWTEDLDQDQGKYFAFYMTMRRFGGIGVTKLECNSLPHHLSSVSALQEGGIIDKVEVPFGFPKD